MNRSLPGKTGSAGYSRQREHHVQRHRGSREPSDFGTCRCHAVGHVMDGVISSFTDHSQCHCCLSTTMCFLPLSSSLGLFSRSAMVQSHQMSLSLWPGPSPGHQRSSSLASPLAGAPWASSASGGRWRWMRAIARPSPWGSHTAPFLALSGQLPPL